MLLIYTNCYRKIKILHFKKSIMIQINKERTIYEKNIYYNTIYYYLHFNVLVAKSMLSISFNLYLTMILSTKKDNNDKR